jgi:predicted PurR-regulated permease PerM
VTQRQLIGWTLTVLAIVVLVQFLLWVVGQIAEILILLLVSAILAAGLAPIVGVVERWRIPGGRRFSRGVAIFVLYLAIFGLILLVFSIILVPAVSEGTRFVEQLPQLLRRIKAWLLDLQGHFPWLPDMAGNLDHLRSLVQVSQLGSQAAGVAFRFLSGIGATITVLVFTFYMLLEGATVKRGFVVLFPASERARVITVLDRIGMKFGGWLRAQLLLSLSVAVPVAIGLTALRMPYPLLLAIIAGIGELIPMVGPTLGAAVAILVALSQQTWQLVGVIIFYLIVLNVEPHILVPRIMSQVVGMSPILTLVALLSGIKLLGILGGLLAVPIAAALQVIVREIVTDLLPGSNVARPTAAASGPPASDPRPKGGAD